MLQQNAMEIVQALERGRRLSPRGPRNPGNEPRISVNRQGRVILNRDAAHPFESRGITGVRSVFEQPHWVIWGHRNGNPHNGHKESSKLTFNKNGVPASFGAKRILDQIGLDQTRTWSLPAQVLIVDEALIEQARGAGLEIATSLRSGDVLLTVEIPA